jgi:hypothetical protein
MPCPLYIYIWTLAFTLLRKQPRGPALILEALHPSCSHHQLISRGTSGADYRHIIPHPELSHQVSELKSLIDLSWSYRTHLPLRTENSPIFTLFWTLDKGYKDSCPTPQPNLFQRALRPLCFALCPLLRESFISLSLSLVFRTLSTYSSPDHLLFVSYENRVG